MNAVMPSGYCSCGCGERTKLAPRTCTSRRWVKGQPLFYILGHTQRGRGGPGHFGWQGGRTLMANGYVGVKRPGHQRCTRNGYVYEHIVVAEQALGKPLPPRAQVHHVSEVKSDNRLQNLVICEDKSYHQLLHRRTQALRASGHVHWRRCRYCRQWDDPANLQINERRGDVFHRQCRQRHWREKGW